MEFRELIVENIRNKSTDICCTISGIPYTYNHLEQFIERYAQSLETLPKSRLGLILRNDFNTYAAAIACIISGVTFVPINPEYPEKRIEDIIYQSEINCCYDSLKSFTFDNLEHLNETEKSNWGVPQIEQYKYCYILFTSGTTGKPKGVPITYGNLTAFFEGFENLDYNVNAEDRFLQMFEMTFDLSVVSYIAPLIYGASFHTLDLSLVKPLALYDALETQKITIALMVPSAIDMLMPYSEDIDLPNLRITQFCGEALKTRQVESWSNCVPHTQIDNVYGPTEATIYCTRYTISNDQEILHHNGIVCIGEAMCNTTLEINEESELCLGGAQVSPGYLNATDKQKSKFFIKDNIRFYLSGDKGKIENNLFYCLGRMDDQVKIQGYRVELAEIEFACNKSLPLSENTAISFEGKTGTELHLFVKSQNLQESHSELSNNLKTLLPWYMVPHEIHWISDFPLNANGKIDKSALRRQLIIE